MKKRTLYLFIARLSHQIPDLSVNFIISVCGPSITIFFIIMTKNNGSVIKLGLRPFKLCCYVRMTWSSVNLWNKIWIVFVSLLYVKHGINDITVTRDRIVNVFFFLCLLYPTTGNGGLRQVLTSLEWEKSCNIKDKIKANL